MEADRSGECALWPLQAAADSVITEITEIAAHVGLPKRCHGLRSVIGLPRMTGNHLTRLSRAATPAAVGMAS